jgi:hypothetical protein
MSAIHRELKCPLTDEERRAKGDEIARTLEAYDLLEDTSKEDSRAAKDELKDLRKHSQKLARQIREGAELRNVECYERPDYAGNVVHLLRTDTGEVVEERPMRMDERQGVLVDIDGPKKKKAN